MGRLITFAGLAESTLFTAVQQVGFLPGEH